MLKALTLIILAAFVGWLIYTTNLFGLLPIQETVNPLTQGIADGAIHLVQEAPTVIFSACSAVATVGALAWKSITSTKNTAEKAIDQATVTSQTKVDEAEAQVTQITKEKVALEQRVAELEDDTYVRSLEKTNTSLETQNETLRREIDKLHEELINRPTVEVTKYK